MWGFMTMFKRILDLFSFWCYIAEKCEDASWGGGPGVTLEGDRGGSWRGPPPLEGGPPHEQVSWTEMHAGAWSLGDWKQFYKHPKFQFTHKLMMKSRHNLTKSDSESKILGNVASPKQWQCTVNGVCKFSVCHSLLHQLASCINWHCNISENLLCEIVEFIVNLWVKNCQSVKWNLGCLRNCFRSPLRTRAQAPARVFKLVFFLLLLLDLSPPRLCALFQCVLCRPELCYVLKIRYWTPENTENFRGECSDTSILMICVCFSNCCFGILMSRSFSFKRSIEKLIRAVSVWRQLAQKKRPIIRYTIILFITILDQDWVCSPTYAISCIVLVYHHVHFWEWMN